MPEESPLVGILPEDSWLRDYMLCWPKTETPRSYLLFSAMALIGAVYGRKVWLQMDHRKLFPMLNLLLIGPSGVGKTTALEIGFDHLVRPLPDGLRPDIVAGKPTPEKLHWDLRNEPHTILYAEELAAFITKQKYMEGMIPYLTELLNYKATIELRTKTNDVVIVDNPEAVLLGGSTINWLQEQLPDSATAGGFLPRFLIIYEQYKYQRCPLPDNTMGKREKILLDGLRDKTFAQFRGLVSNGHGPLQFRDYDASDIYTLWYSSHTPATGHLEPFAQRAGEFILRLAMLVTLSCGRVHIEARDVECAIQLYQYSEKSLQQVVVPYTQEGHLLSLIMEAIGNKQLTDKQIRKAMGHHIGSKKVDEYIQSLILSGDLIALHDNHFARRQNATT